MKNFLILCSIFIFAYLVRFYHFEDRVIFWTEQARSLQTSLGYLDKPSLLGQEYFRQDSNFHTIYSGALFNYALLPIILFSRYSVIKITIFFGFLNILTGLLVYLVARRFFGAKTAVFSSILFLFSSLMIYHSLFIWNYNLLPAVGLLIFLLVLKNFKNYDINNFFWLGVISGIGFGLQILFMVYAFIALVISILKSPPARVVQQKISSFLLFAVGFVIGNLPMFIFDVRHDFYQSRTIFQYLIDTIHGTSDAGFAYYYLLPIIPVVAIFFGFLLSKINNYISLLLIIVYLYFNLNSALHIPNSDLTVSQIDYTSRIIALDSKGDFNVVSDIDFDKRAYPIRYYLKYVYHKNVLGIDKYQNINLLYVLAPVNYNYKNSDTWEIKSGGNYKVTMLKNINNKYSLYKLTK